MNKKFSLNMILVRFVMICYSVIVLYPMIWTALTSFKTNKEFYQNPWALPKALQFDNYIRAWVQSNFNDYFINSIIVTVFPLVISIVLASTTAYVLARFSFKGRKIFQFLYLSGLMVPAVLTIIPSFFLLKKLHMLDSLLGLICIYTARTLPFSMFVLIGFFKTMPRALEEAAMIDGCSHNRTFWSIMFPMATSGLVTVNIFNFIYYWNEFILGLTFISTASKKTLPVGMAGMMEVARYKTDWGALFAGLMMIMIPTFIFYVIFQKKISKGLTSGALKG